MNTFSVRVSELIEDRLELAAVIEPRLKVARLSRSRLRASTAR